MNGHSLGEEARSWHSLRMKIGDDQPFCPSVEATRPTSLVATSLGHAGRWPEHLINTSTAMMIFEFDALHVLEHKTPTQVNGAPVRKNPISEGP